MKFSFIVRQSSPLTYLNDTLANTTPVVFTPNFTVTYATVFQVNTILVAYTLRLHIQSLLWC